MEQNIQIQQRFKSQKQFYENLYDDKHNTDNRSINDMLGENKK